MQSFCIPRHSEEDMTSVSDTLVCPTWESPYEEQSVTVQVINDKGIATG